MDQIITNKILSDLEHGYDQMSHKFSGTRKYFWRDLEFIADYINDNDAVLDYGCGNGRLIEILKNKKIDYTGVDVSREFINSAKNHYFGYNFQKISSQVILPFNDEKFNKIVSVAVFHHFPQEHAVIMANELYRITKPGGAVIITVWNLWQGRFRKYIFNPKIILSKILQKEKFIGLGFKDIYVPFKNNNQKEYFDRYHHTYTKRELKKIFSLAGFKIDGCYVLSGKNIILIGSK